MTSAPSSVLDLPLTYSAPRKLALFIFLGAAGLFLCSGARLYLFRSGAFDMGVFDQAVYLISQGETPNSSMLGYHILGDHASLALYPFSLFYMIWPNGYVLLVLQALILAAGAYPVWQLARLGNVSSNVAMAMVAAYLSFPLILTSNLSDFHPEVLVVPAFLMAILTARQNRRASFVLWIILALSTKEIISVTVAGFGLYLLLIEKRRFPGLFALVAGVLWFIIATKLIIPYFGNGKNPSGIWFYRYLGRSIGEILLNCITRPELWLRRFASVVTIKYLCFILVPIWWAVHPKSLAPLLAATPAILLNLLSSNPSQHGPFEQYMLPIIPFLFVVMVDAAANHRAWLARPAPIVTWSIAMVVLGVSARLVRIQNPGETVDWQTISHVKQAVALVPPHGSVLTTFEITPHLCHRPTIDFFGVYQGHQPPHRYDHILINTKNASLDSPKIAAELAELFPLLKTSGEFEAIFTAPDVFLYRRVASAALPESN